MTKIQNHAIRSDSSRRPRERMISSMNIRESDTSEFLRPTLGLIKMELRDSNGDIVESRSYKNVVVRTASILAARMFKDNTDPKNGAFVWALGIGAGDKAPGTFDLQNPPAATIEQTELKAEIARKTFSSSTFIDSNGNETSTATNIVDFSVVFAENEAVGALTEMGLLGGDIDDPPVSGTGTLITYRTFAVLNKPSGSTLSMLWRLTF